MSRIAEGSFITLAGVAALASVLAGCAATTGVDTGVDTDVAAEALDPFYLAIEAERYGILISYAAEGAIAGPPAMTASEAEADDRLRVAHALREATFGLYALRALTCARGMVGAEACGALPPPAWLGAAPDERPDVEALRERIDWLAEAAWPHIEAGCDAGRSRQTDPEEPPFCSVE